MNIVPTSWIPEAAMTVPQFYDYCSMMRKTCPTWTETHPNPVKPGMNITVQFLLHKKKVGSYTIQIIGDSWGEFDALRENWEKERKVTA